MKPLGAQMEDGQSFIYIEEANEQGVMLAWSGEGPQLCLCYFYVRDHSVLDNSLMARISNYLCLCVHVFVCTAHKHFSSHSPLDHSLSTRGDCNISSQFSGKSDLTN